MSKDSFWHVSSQMIRLFIRFVQFVLAFVVILIVIGFWRLSVSPVNIDFLVPKLAQHLLPKDSGLSLSVGSIFLKTGFRKDGLLHIDVEKLNLLRADGTIIAQAPQIVMSYGLWNILTLNYLPDTLTANKPVLQGVIDESGDFYIQGKRIVTDEAHALKPVELNTSENALVLSTDIAVSMAVPSALVTHPSFESKDDLIDESEETTNVLERVQTEDVDALIHYFLRFKRFEITDASLVLDDRYLNRNVGISDITFLLETPFGGIPHLHSSGVIFSQNASMNVMLNATLNRRFKQVPFNISFNGVNLSKFSEFIPVFKTDDLPIKGVVNGRFDFSKDRKDIRKSLVELAFKLETEKPGKISLPAPLTNDYPVHSALIQGVFSPDLSSLEVSDSTIELSTGPKASITASVTGLDHFLKTFDVTEFKAQLNAHVTGVSMDQVPSVWPKALGPDAHEWVEANLNGGQVTKADFTLYFSGMELVDLFGRCFVEGVSVRYLEQLPIIEGVAGEVLLYPDKVEIFADQGHSGQILLKKANIALTELTDPISNAEINLTADGPVVEALDLIALKPLEFPQMFGLEVNRTDGLAHVDLSLHFPLIETLKLDQVQVRVEADMTNAVLPVPETQITLSEGSFKLNVDNQQLVLEGQAEIGQIPIAIKWTEFFNASKKEDVQSEYDISSDVNTEFLKTWMPDIVSYAKGQMPIRVRLEKQVNGHQKFDITTDLKDCLLNLYPISTVKQIGADAKLSMSGDINAKKEVNAAFHLVSNDKLMPIDIQGKIQGQEGITLTLDHVVSSGNHFSGTFNLDAQKNIGILLQGASWNASDLFKMPFFSTMQSDSGKQKESQWELPEMMNVTVDLDQLTFQPDLPLRHVEIEIERQRNLWQKLHVFASAAKPLSIEYDAPKQVIQMQTENLGDLLNRLSITNRFSEGRLSGTVEQSSSGGLKGTLTVRSFNYIDPGFFVQAVTILGIVNAITGSELSFKKAVIPFEVTPKGEVKVSNGYAYGTTLGVTFNGSLEPGTLFISGSVLPAYIINSLLGRIPLIGRLFRDGDGGGLVGVRYTVSGSLFEPEVHFNPLASMAPGALGGLFH